MMSSPLAAGIRHLRGKLAAQQRCEDSDEQLLHAFLTHRDESAFAVLVRRHGPMVLHVCRCLLKHQQDAEDAFQATFLVLARNAAALRKKSSLASFLHGIAYRTAMKAKRAAARRRKHEQQAPSRPFVDTKEELSWREVRALLNEEVARLPEIYRSVFVLCCLEELSREEAARRLGLKERTVLSRLSGARKRLAQRLARRGVELTAALAVSALATQAVSAGLMAATLKAASAAAAGKGMAGLVPASVAELAEGAATALLSKSKIAAVMVLAVGLLGGTCLWWSDVFPASQQAPPSLSLRDGEKNADGPRQAKRETAKTSEIHGRVLGTDGKPKAGAKLLLLSKEGKITPLGVSAADGRFTVTVPKGPKFDFPPRYLFAQAEGTGIDFLSFDQAQPEKPVEFHLVKDNVIRGQVVNTEGKPIRGVRVIIEHVGIYANNSLDAFLVRWKQRDPRLPMPWGEKTLWSKVGGPLPVQTDAEGRFALHGAGAERLVSLRFSGAGIADTVSWIINREGFDPKCYNEATHRNVPSNFGSAPKWTLYGPNVSIVAEAEKPIRGVVKDADSGKGRPHVLVHLTASEGGFPLDVMLQAKTDSRGRYEIHGAHKAKKYLLEVVADTSAGYMDSQIWADDTPGYEPIIVDIPAKKGVIITGKVIDQATGKSVPGFVQTGVLFKNPFAKAYPEFNSSRLGQFDYTAEDDTFRIVTLPGPVLLMGGLAYGRMPGGLVEMMKYKPVLPDPKYPQYFTKDLKGFNLGYQDFRGGVVVVEGNASMVLDIKPGVEVVKQDILLQRANALPMKIQDAEGRPLAGVWVKGISSERWRDAVRIENDSGSVYHLEAGKPRLLVFYHPERKLAASLTLNGDEKAPVTVKLGPAGVIKGRLLDADGKPLAGAVVEIGYREREAWDVHQMIHKAKQVVTDATGAFAFEGLIPGRKFYLEAIHRSRRLDEEGSKPRDPIVREVQPGECRDLGTLKWKTK
jgi:RNA polymerase sigma factor (sigma-70 family)